MRDYRKYQVWKDSHEFVLKIYKVTENYPPAEQFRLVNQMCRASSSIPTNIVEGCGRETEKEFKRYLVMARGSANEMEYHLLLSRDLGYINEEVYQDLFDQVNRVIRSLTNLIKKLE
jgi:four helix bundle protein